MGRYLRDREVIAMADILSRGIDVSKYQPNVDFNKVKAAGYSFVILKAGHGKYDTQIDPTFEKHYEAAKKAGLRVGAYWYAYAKTADDAKKEAEVFIRALSGKRFEMPVWYDIEERATFNTGRTNVSNIASAFCTALEDAGYFCGIYGGQELAEQYLTDNVRTRYAFWLAQYLKTPKYKGQYGMWQYGVAAGPKNINPTGAAGVPGVLGQCDLDYCYVDYFSKIKQKGLNGYSKATPTIPSNPYPAPTVALREGDEGEPVKWLQWQLEQKGYFKTAIDGKFDTITLGAVLAFQFKNGLDVDGVCGPKTQQALKA
jgi:hypothetical protein